MARNPKFMQLLASVKDATEQGRLKWAETIDEETFRVVLKGAIIRLSRVFVDDVDGGSFYVVARLADHDGHTLDVWTVTDLPAEQSPEFLDSLFDLARRSAKNVDDLLDHLISEVENQPGARK